MNLRQAWLTTVGDTPAARRHGDELLTRWSEPHRHYHSISHLEAVLDALDILAEETRHPGRARLAAWFHDAVYDGKPGEDERASAELARSVLTELAFPEPDIDEVIRLVLLTTEHRPEPGDHDGAALCDADLSILGADTPVYAAYAASVRRDYAHVPDDAFRRGRAAVLRGLLDREWIFHTWTGRKRWETAARTNLHAELTALSHDHEGWRP